MTTEAAPKTGRRPRVLLTKHEAATECGSDLLTLLCEIGHDGDLSPDEVDRLRLWLEEHGNSPIAGIQHLTAVVGEALRDGVLTDDERVEILLEIERVLPVRERAAVVDARRQRERIRWAEERSARAAERDAAYERALEATGDDSDDWEDDPATDAQLRYIRALGDFTSAPTRKGEASEIIETLLAQPKRPSGRQQMVIRFWGVDLGDASRADVSEWMDRFYEEDSRRVRAWELYKQETGDQGGQRDPSSVQLRLGYTYLERVKAAGGRVAGPTARLGLPWAVWVALGAASMLAVALLLHVR